MQSTPVWMGPIWPLIVSEIKISSGKNGRSCHMIIYLLIWLGLVMLSYIYDPHHHHHASENPIMITQFLGPNKLHTMLALNNCGGLCFETSAHSRHVCLLIYPLCAAPNALALPSYLTLIGHWEAVNFDTSWGKSCNGAPQMVLVGKCIDLLDDWCL